MRRGVKLYLAVVACEVCPKSRHILYFNYRRIRTEWAWEHGLFELLQSIGMRDVFVGAKRRKPL